MTMLRFDGVEYLDGTASDPNSLGWMHGSPPPSDKRIRFQDDHFLEFPQNRWTLSHMRELVPTVNVWRGSGHVNAIGSPAVAHEAAIDAITFDDTYGQGHRWYDSLLDTYTEASSCCTAAGSSTSGISGC